MSPDSLPLLELFTRLRDMARLPLGTGEYEVMLKALQGGFGVQDRAALKRLCEALWTKNEEEKQQLAYHFDQLIPLEPETVDAPMVLPQVLPSLPQLMVLKYTLGILATALVGAGIVMAALSLPRINPQSTQVPAAPSDQAGPGFALDGVDTTDPVDPETKPDTPPAQQPNRPEKEHKEFPEWLKWVIIGMIALPTAVLAAGLLLYLWRKRQRQPLPKHSSDTFSKANRTIQDEIEAAKAKRSSSQTSGNRFLLSGSYLPITQRQMKRSWRYLSRPVREGTPTELDVEATIEQIGQEGLFLEPVLVPARTNRAALLLLVDQDGSMVPFHNLTERLVATAQRGGRFSQTYVYYFHNCPVGSLYRDAICLEDEPIAQVLEQLPLRQLTALVVSDAGATRNGYNPYRVEKTQAFLAILSQQVRHSAWLNPMPKQRWAGTTAAAIAGMIPMFGCDRAGLDGAIEVLRGRKRTVEVGDG